MITVANPIYDIVFKYLMEDERIARTILSALLKKDVVEVHVRRNEYSNQQRDSLSIFRIDFGATIREDDGTERLILIEVQKTWLPTETLRFRQYLGVHYENKENMMVGDNHEYALPMVAVYILGHKVGDIEEPVIYVRHYAYDYDDKPIERGVPDSFVDSLDSIIVQIPRLHGKINNRLDKVLSIFDQTNIDKHTNQTLRIDDSLYKDDSDMAPIIHRLLVAAADVEMRHSMNVEDEYFSIIEDRDTEILLRDKKLAEQKVVLKQMKQDVEQAKQDVELAKQEKEQMLKKTVATLKAAGLSAEAIASSLGVDVDAVMRAEDS